MQNLFFNLFLYSFFCLLHKVSSTTSQTLQPAPDLVTTLKTYKNELDQHVQNLSQINSQIHQVELTLPNSIKEKLDQIQNVGKKINWIENSSMKKDKSLLNYLAILKNKNKCIAEYNKFVSGLPSEFRLKTTPTNIQTLFFERIKKLEKDLKKSVNELKHPQPKNESEEKKDTELDINKSATDQKSKKDEKKIPEIQTSNADENLDEESKIDKNVPDESLNTLSGEATRKESSDNNQKSLSNDIPSAKGFKILVGMLGSFASLLLISIKFV